MSFVLASPPLPTKELTRADLPAAHTMHVPPLCPAVIPHPMHLIHIEQGHEVLLLGLSNVFQERNLLVVSCLIGVGGRLSTVVFNFSKVQVVIKRGEVLSRLISVEVT